MLVQVNVIGAFWCSLGVRRGPYPAMLVEVPAQATDQVGGVVRVCGS